MMPIFLLMIILIVSLLPIIIYKNDKLLIKTIQIIMVSLIILITSYTLYQQDNTIYNLTFLSFNNISLTISIQFDIFAKIMMIFILLIGTLIYRYAQNYLESDNTRIRFLAQLNLVLLSVLFLVMSANLLTAFLAWQMIGINLYLLLNHYHHDPEANRAAKKKFVINRIGDCSFLVAIVLAYHTQSGTSFQSIQSSSHAELICGLLFISVMTKCAQFPFHIWLLDTMETPTPVSALMHAGVINAGGILLTRVSGALVHFHSLASVILFVGLINAILSICWMNQQPDTKKKLAYSTMGQMGYMLAQCSLGAFSAAIFHLMSHGFYKASLFLNAGETLQTNEDKDGYLVKNKNIVIALILTFIIFFSVLVMLREHVSHIPLLIYGFIFLTVMTLVLKINMLKLSHEALKLFYYLIIAAILYIYLYFFHIFVTLLPQYNYSGTIALSVQIIILFILFALQYYSWIKPKYIEKYQFRDHTELFLRRFILNPIRFIGNIINFDTCKNTKTIFYMGTMFLLVASFVYGVMHNTHIVQSDIEISRVLTFMFLAIGVISLVVANRCLSIQSLIAYLILFEVAFTNIAFFDLNKDIVKIGIFHILNVGAVLIMLALLARKSRSIKTLAQKNNRLLTRAFYLVFSLLLLIGVPGTASFISEFYLLSSLMYQNSIFVIMYLGLILLIAIVVMHSLQLYAFNKKYSELLTEPITKQNHLIFSAIIIVNVVSGLFPNIVLSHL